MPPDRKRKIKEVLRAVAREPRAGKLLQEELAGLLSYRVGMLRIIYTLDLVRKVTHIIAIGPRESIYAEVERDIAYQQRGGTSS
ncbi:MAG: type II toxin-antitoxin system RelE/ParE family toxin [Deltaproteobacteria bacterium]|nr:type II toxin-antitoxin system RelE/ParE family toxin [Deltaproteobacteria bacterium]